jgi:hypothetical protein
MVYLRIETLFQNSFDKFLISKIKRCMEAWLNILMII